MAFLGDDERLRQDQQVQEQPGAQAPALAGGGSLVGGNAPNAAAKGTGGNPGWTNIQNYLTANKDSTATADYLKQQVGSVADTERANAQKASTDAQTQAQNAVSSAGIGTDQASKLLQQASAKYNPGTANTAGANPAAAISQLQSALKAQYQGPTQFNYAQSKDFQQNAANIQNDAGFKAIMNSLYDKSGTRGVGKTALQSQLDQENPALATAKTEVKNKYDTASKDIAGYRSAAEKALAEAPGQVESKRSALEGYLKGQASDAQGRLNAAVQDYGSASNRAYKQAQDNLKAALQKSMEQGALSQWAAQNNNPVEIGTYGADRVWRPEVTPAMMNYFSKYIDRGGSANLENAPGADDARAKWNAIQEVLGSGGLLANGAAPSVAKFNQDQFIKDILAGANAWNAGRGQINPSDITPTPRGGDAVLPVWNGSMRR